MLEIRTCVVLRCTKRNGLELYTENPDTMTFRGRKGNSHMHGWGRCVGESHMCGVFRLLKHGLSIADLDRILIINTVVIRLLGVNKHNHRPGNVDKVCDVYRLLSAYRYTLFQVHVYTSCLVRVFVASIEICGAFTTRSGGQNACIRNELSSKIIIL